MRKSALFGLMLGFASLGAASAACSSTATTTPDPNSDGGTNPGDDSGTNTNNDGGTTGGSSKTGFIRLNQTVIGSTISSNASAGFTNVTGSGGGGGGTNPNCETTTEGTCVATICDKNAATPDAGAESDAGATSVAVSAGDISVEALKNFTLTYDSATGGYTAQTFQEKIFDTGGQIHVTAAGADVPTFDDTISAPPSLTFTKPVAPALPAKLSIDTTKSFDFEWTGGAAGSLSVIMSFQDSAKTGSVICAFDASTGSSSVPATIMGKLPKGDGAVITATATSESLPAGDYTVNISASATGTTILGTTQ